ncbi:signal peptidase I [Brevibacillus nitrificans]|uniref:Signal peptidase I n=1 Tax=Brevibacillus nitrificans TaxID=651560 RepID=A0A3M8D131_9BACL|nr:signal peptidase I [Brevibacillus nitrificans]RNB81419.1 signal peptidase I [Brevibacillus nitrificans]
MALLKKSISVLTSVLLVAVIAIAGFLLVGKMNSGKTMLFGNEIMVVLSGSMTPTFTTGSIVAVGPAEFKDIKQGDIITFKDTEGRTITHRVIEKQESNLVTKGDANDAADTAPVTADRLIGKVQYSVPYLGYFIEYAKSGLGMLVLLGLPGVYLIISQIWKLMKMMREESQNATKSQA